MSFHEDTKQNNGSVLAPHLFAGERRCPSLILPLAQEQFTQKRVEGLLLISILLAPTSILLLQCS